MGRLKNIKLTSLFKAFEEKRLQDQHIPKLLTQLSEDWHVQDLQKLRQAFTYTKHLGSALQPKIFNEINVNQICGIDASTRKVSKSCVIRIKSMIRKGMLSLE